jgi:hypothetical protein
MLAGEPPFVGATARAIIARHVVDAPTGLPILRATVPVELDALVRRALAKSPADRFGTGAQMIAALATAGDTAERPLGGSPLGKRRRFARNSLTWVLASATVAAAAMILWPRDSATNRGPQATVDTTRLPSPLPQLQDARGPKAPVSPNTVGRTATVAAPRGRGLAVLTFANGSIGRYATELAPLEHGIRDLLMSELVSISQFKLIESSTAPDHAGSVRIDNTQDAQRAGRILGADAVVYGGYVGDASGRLRIVARWIRVGDRAVERTEVVQGSQDSILTLIADLSAKLRCRVDGARPDTPGCVATAGSRAKLDIRMALVYSRALDTEDQGNVDSAMVLYSKVLERVPTFEPARARLEKLRIRGRSAVP